METAKMNALTGISGFLETNITTSVHLTEEEIERREGSNINSRQSQSISSDVKVNTRGNLQFAEIKETWYDEKAKLWYAIAVIERDKVLDFYGNAITDNERLIALKMDDQLQITQTIKNYTEALNLYRDNMANYYYYNAFTTYVAQNRFPIINESILLQKIRNAKLQMPLSILINNDDNRQVETVLKDNLRENGFTVVDESDYQLIGDVSITDSREMNKQHFIKMTANLKLVFKEEELLQLSAQANQGDRDETSAMQRSIISLARKISKDLISAFGL